CARWDPRRRRAWPLPGSVSRRVVGADSRGRAVRGGSAGRDGERRGAPESSPGGVRAHVAPVGSCGRVRRCGGVPRLRAPRYFPVTEHERTAVLRTHEAGSLRAGHADSTVTLAGWVARRRDHGGVIFIDLRDASGVAQVVFRESDVAAAAHRLRSEFCITVTGRVEIRPEGNENPEIPTGAIEVNVTGLEVLSESDALPFQLDDAPGEETRLRYRYLDLRRAGPGAALRLRSQANAAARRVLERREFVEIETPTMTRSTPEGARDFLVPARLRPGSFYALPQSPQLFKQLLMVAGMERYYQIARCYRDEDSRADRQPEFTQLDVEMSFVDQEDVIGLSEEILAELWKLAGHELT